MRSALHTRRLIALIVLTLVWVVGAGSRARGARAGRTVSGTVIDAVTRQPIPLVRVAASFHGPSWSTDGVATDAQGKFTLTDLPASALAIRAKHPAYVDGQLGVRRLTQSGPPLVLDPDEALNGQQILMWRNARVTGTVRDAAGRPMGGVMVRALGVRYAGASRLLEGGAHVQTDPSGVFYFLSLAPGRYVFAVISPSVTGPRESSPTPGSPSWVTEFAPGTVSPADAAIVEIAANEWRQMDLTYTALPSVAVSGTVETAGDKSVELRLVSDVVNARVDHDLARVRSDAAGRFVFPAVPAGRYRILVADLPVGGPATPGFRSAILKMGSGSFEVNGISSSPNPIVSPADTPTRWANVEVVVGREPVTGLTVALRPGLHITGQYLFDGATTPSSEVLAATPVLPLSINGNVFDKLAVGGITPDGHFRTAGLPAGRYALMPLNTPMASWQSSSVTVNGDAKPFPILDLSDGDANVAITLTDRQSSVSGIVRDASGTPRPDASIYLFPFDREHRFATGWYDPEIPLQLLPDRHGRYTAVVRPGDYFIAASMLDERDYQHAVFTASLVPTATRVIVAPGKPSVIDLIVK